MNYNQDKINDNEILTIDNVLSILKSINTNTIKTSPQNRRIIYGVMSSDNKDIEDEIVRQSGMDLDTYFAKHGRVKWEHNEIKGANAYIGTPLAYRKMKDKTILLAELFPEESNMPVANDVWKLIQSSENQGSPLGFSIEGKYVQKEGSDVKKSFVVNVVITPNPVNPDTEVNILKSLNATPITSDFANMTGGQAISKENTAKNITKVNYNNNKRSKAMGAKGVNKRKELEEMLKDKFSDDEIKKACKALELDEEDEMEKNMDHSEAGYLDKSRKRKNNDTEDEDYEEYESDEDEGEPEHEENETEEEEVEEEKNAKKKGKKFGKSILERIEKSLSDLRDKLFESRINADEELLAGADEEEIRKSLNEYDDVDIDNIDINNETRLYIGTAEVVGRTNDMVKSMADVIDGMVESQLFLLKSIDKINKRFEESDKVITNASTVSNTNSIGQVMLNLDKSIIKNTTNNSNINVSYDEKTKIAEMNMIKGIITPDEYSDYCDALRYNNGNFVKSIENKFSK